MSSSVFKVTLVALNETDEIKKRELLLSPTMPIQIGRSSRTESKNITAAASNCYLKSPVVSRNHAVITVDDTSGAAVLTDLASMHGSCVNGTQLEKNIRRPLKHGDVLTFGTGVLRGEVTHEPPKFLFECVKHTATQPLKNGVQVTRVDDVKRTTFMVPESDVSSASDNGSDMVEEDEIHESDALSDEDDTHSIDSDAASETFYNGNSSNFMVLDDFTSTGTSQQGGDTASDVNRDIEKVDSMHAAAATLHSRPWETGFATSYVHPEPPAASCLPISEAQWFLPPRPEDFDPHPLGRFNPSLLLRPIPPAQSNIHQQQIPTVDLCTPPRTDSAENLPESGLPNESAKSKPLAAPENSMQQCPEADSGNVKAEREACVISAQKAKEDIKQKGKELSAPQLPPCPRPRDTLAEETDHSRPKTGIAICEIVHSGPSGQVSEATRPQTSRPNGLKRKADELSQDVEPEDPAPTLKSAETNGAAAQPQVQPSTTDTKAAGESVSLAELSLENTKPTLQSEGARHKRVKLQIAASAVAGAVVGGLGVFATLLTLPETLFE